MATDATLSTPFNYNNSEKDNKIINICTKFEVSIRLSLNRWHRVYAKDMKINNKKDCTSLVSK